MGLARAEQSAILGKVVVDGQPRNACPPRYFGDRGLRWTNLLVELHRSLDDARARLSLALGTRLELVLSAAALNFV
jgi:hypothetical protein